MTIRPDKVNELVETFRALGFSVMADEHSVTAVIKRNRARFNAAKESATDEEWRAAMRLIGDRLPHPDWKRT